ncbi:bro [Hemileuca sp. nucleopolyhedrovirus]|uniref:Bro n=1 Tax=Hemileuca sp. nucleopolyhedrovirus TaxID=1367203 RepID=S5MK19_9ABAC|nr:bro [Hemileuca sp. nucleopolyhedrovirus]AGR56801.1 bro [Hemileuca sp. nucleopolyhedrovirus]
MFYYSLNNNFYWAVIRIFLSLKNTVMNNKLNLTPILHKLKTMFDSDMYTKEQVIRLICDLIEKNDFSVIDDYETLEVDDYKNDTIIKPQNSRLLHALAVCELSSNRFAFLRTQMRSLNRSLKKLTLSEKTKPTVIYQIDYVPNSINVLNKIKEQLPKDKFKAKNNQIQLTDDCSSKFLVDILIKIMKR